MNLNFFRDLGYSNSSTIILPYFKDYINYRKIIEYSGMDQSVHFDGTLSQVLILYNNELKYNIFLLGLGDPKDKNKLHKVFRSFAFQNHQKWDKEFRIEVDHLDYEVVYEMALGFGLAEYRLDGLKTSQKPIPFYTSEFTINVYHSDKAAERYMQEGLYTAEVLKKVMYLIDTPSNIKVPSFIASYVEDLATEYGVGVKLFDAPALKEMGMQALLSVGQGSPNPPVMVQLSYNGAANNKKTKKIGLVGKGITFDTGGISIKSALNMHYMKSDMGGAAAVAGIVLLAAKLKLNVNITGVLVLAENSVDGNSIRPSDVISSYLGKSIEVIDTDAEGRLVLADGLAYVNKNFKPDYLIDLATLTGSCVMTLGYAAACMFTNNDKMAKEFSLAGEKVQEKVWRLPLWDSYASDIESDVADVKNLSGRPINGAISAAKFLEAFVDGNDGWCHLDIAGVAFGDSEFARSKSATGWGPRLVVEWMKTLQ